MAAHERSSHHIDIANPVRWHRTSHTPNSASPTGRGTTPRLSARHGHRPRAAGREAPADGVTNRDIAQPLFITTATAKAPVNRVLRKLDITPREQLADALSGVSDDNREPECQRDGDFLEPRPRKA